MFKILWIKSTKAYRRCKEILKTTTEGAINKIYHQKEGINQLNYLKLSIQSNKDWKNLQKCFKWGKDPSSNVKWSEKRESKVRG